VRREYNIPENTKIIGMVALVAAAKDYATLAQAAARTVAIDKNVRFLIIGDHSGTTLYREHFEEVKRMLAAEAVTEYFIFTDFQPNVTRFLDAMDIFVLSTHGEGLPLVILEAMAQSKPVLATRVGGIPEIVVDKKTGLLHQPQDDEQLSAHILALLKNEELSIRLGKAGRQAVETDWSRKRFARDMKNLYMQMLTGKENNFDASLMTDSLNQLKENKL
jgi:glycosyltransferase involved in cell wall biosynthesis